MRKIGIIGGGFSGTMTAVQLVEKAIEPIEIIIIDASAFLSKGIAYSSYSDVHLLNVTAGKMSAFPDKPTHFLDWVMDLPEFKNSEKTLISNSFLPRNLYGNYLSDVWKQALSLAKSKNIRVTFIDDYVQNIEVAESHILVFLKNDASINVDDCVIATGNHLPRNPKILNEDFYKSKHYHQNPWSSHSVKDIQSKLPVLIIGNGLTMVDTVLAILEQGFKGKIYAISPNGFNILPHRHNGEPYTKLVEELDIKMSLTELVALFDKHINIVRPLGISAEPVIDSLRPYTQRIWKNLTDDDKRLFMSKFRHLWGVARHRLPLHTHDKIQQLRIDGKLLVQSGSLINIIDKFQHIEVAFYDKKEQQPKLIEVSRVINCTGPETDIMKLDDHFLKRCLLKGMIKQDALALGIVTNAETFQVINSDGKTHKHLFTLGSNLKGELWESTAVNELRTQAEKLALNLISNTS